MRPARWILYTIYEKESAHRKRWAGKERKEGRLGECWKGALRVNPLEPRKAYAFR